MIRDSFSLGDGDKNGAQRVKKRGGKGKGNQAPKLNGTRALMKKGLNSNEEKGDGIMKANDRERLARS